MHITHRSFTELIPLPGNTWSYMMLYRVGAIFNCNVIIRCMAAHDTQSFYTPDAFLCQQDQLLSETYNLAHVLLNRSHTDYLFIPIRSLQYLAVIEKEIFWFVDSQAYAVKGDEGGRLVTISWSPVLIANEREGLNQHMGCHVIFYGKDMSEVQNRLRGEFYQAMKLIDQRYRDSHIPSSGAQILPLNT